MCPICRKEQLTLVSWVFGDHLGAVSGSARSTEELVMLAAALRRIRGPRGGGMPHLQLESPGQVVRARRATARRRRAAPGPGRAPARARPVNSEGRQDRSAERRPSGRASADGAAPRHATRTVGRPDRATPAVARPVSRPTTATPRSSRRCATTSPPRIAIRSTSSRPRWTARRRRSRRHRPPRRPPPAAADRRPGGPGSGRRQLPVLEQSTGSGCAAGLCRGRRRASCCRSSRSRWPT